MSYTSSVLADNPFCYYRCNEISGAVAHDSSVNGYNATINGGVIIGQSSETGGAFLLDGSTGYIELPVGVNVAGWTAITVEMWIKLSTAMFSQNPRILANDHTDQDNNGFQWALNAGGNGGFLGIGNGTTQQGANFSQVFTASEWYYIAGTWDGSTIQLYVNGLPNGSTASLSGPIGTPSNVIDIGRNPAYSGDYAPASVSEVAIYRNVALSSARVAAHYAAGHTAPSVLLPTVSRRDAAFSSFIRRLGDFITTRRRG